MRTITMVDVELIPESGMFGAFAVLAVAPFIVIYAASLIALTPITGILLWLALGAVRACAPRRSVADRAAPTELQEPFSRADREERRSVELESRRSRLAGRHGRRKIAL